MKITNIRILPEEETHITKHKKKHSKHSGGKAKKVLTWLLRATAVGVLLLTVMFIYFAKDLPDPNKLVSRTVPESTKIFSRDGQLIYEVHGEIKRTQVGLDQISPYLKQATVAVEDKDFYNNNGISIKGILRSMYKDVLALEKRQGGSTITQQFVKNAILTNEKRWSRKIKEIILSLEINAKFSKDDILKLYLNEIPYGKNAYGVEAASQTYFNKHAKDLTLAESAYIAAIPQAPTRYNPFGPNRQLLDDRKNLILRFMREQGYITVEQESQAKEEKVTFNKIKTGITAPHFVLYVQDYLAQKYGEKTLQEGGLKVYTTLDTHLQEIAEQSVKEGVEKSVKRNKNNNAALVAMNPKTGEILAMVGSKDYFADPEPAGCNPGKNCVFEPSFNVATSERQPGSSIKPYIYATAFNKQFKYAPASLIMDVVTNFGKFGNKDYIPKNYNFQQHGPLSMRQALAGSLNVPAVKTLALVGVDNAVQTLRDVGFTSPLSNCGLSLVLGGCEVKLLDHVAGYAVFANGGVRNEKTAILKVENKDGSVLEEYKPHPEQVVDPEAAYEIVSIMTDNNARSFIFGANSPLTLPGRPVGAKTGTTQNWRDGWTVGYTPSLVAGVWTGNNDGTLMRQGADGVVVAAPIWHQFMQEALKDTPSEDFPVPSGITKIEVDSLSGKLPTSYSPSTKTEVFADYALPTEQDNVHLPVVVDTRTNQPATNETPEEFKGTRVYTVLRSEKPDNPNWENPVIAWAQANGFEYPPNLGTIIAPSENQTVDISIVDPVDESTLPAEPFKVTVTAASKNSIARVELLIDGESLQSLSTTPFSFAVNKKLTGGSHTITAKAIDLAGNTATTSIQVTTDTTAGGLQIIDPLANSQVTLPINITARGAENLENNVNFYYQSGNTISFIGTGSPLSTQGRYEYTTTWQQIPAPGSYKIFAKSASGLQSPKISVTVSQ